ncbi:MAG: signal peptidase I [Methanocellales archaeon]|nr:signal peptidase I [Methanocellales archaeon]
MDKSFWIGLAKDVVFAVTVVAVIASLAYLLAGTWPVMVAVESGSMMPHMYRGDVVFIQGISRTNIITYRVGKEINYTSFGDYGDVIVYRPDGNPNVMPIIHRAMYWVDVGDMVPDGARAPHSGYITKGDHNSGYDQPGLSGPVKPEWIVGVAKARIPWIGYFRLAFGSDVTHITGFVRVMSY